MYAETTVASCWIARNVIAKRAATGPQSLLWAYWFIFQYWSRGYFPLFISMRNHGWNAYIFWDSGGMIIISCPPVQSWIAVIIILSWNIYPLWCNTTNFCVDGGTTWQPLKYRDCSVCANYRSSELSSPSSPCSITPEHFEMVCFVLELKWCPEKSDTFQLLAVSSHALTVMIQTIHVHPLL